MIVAAMAARKAQVCVTATDESDLASPELAHLPLLRTSTGAVEIRMRAEGMSDCLTPGADRQWPDRSASMMKNLFFQSRAAAVALPGAGLAATTMAGCASADIQSGVFVDSHSGRRARLDRRTSRDPGLVSNRRLACLGQRGRFVRESTARTYVRAADGRPGCRRSGVVP